MLRFLPPLLVLLLCTCARAQLGLHPPSVDWQQIVLPEGRIVFPKGFEARAKRVATLLELLEAKHNRSVGEQHYPFDLVLQTTNTTINGYVGLAPFRSEFFVTPPQQQNLLSTTEWTDLLTIHEYRHVQQNSNERRGITKLASYLFGQQGWAGFSFLATPNWFSEGDAVIAETALSAGGRGRTPAFSGELRALLDNDIVYRYSRARNGSFKKLVPDHYRYGYAMLTLGRERFGNDVWKSVFQDGAAYRGLFYSFSRALRKKTGYTTPEWYRTTMNQLETEQDSAQAARGPFTEGIPRGQEHKSVVNYRFPQMDEYAKLYALRSGYQYRPALVRIAENGGKDEHVTYVGIQREPYVDLRDNLAVWMENRQHPRYTNLDYSEIIVYELNSGRKRQLTSGGKYFYPTLSPDRREIAAVYHDPLAGPPRLVILATDSGDILEDYRIGATALLQPRFGPDGRTVYFLHQDYAGIAIRALDRDGGKVATVRTRSTANIDQLRVVHGTLTFSSGRDGIDNVYQLDPATGETRQLTNARIGALFPRIVTAGELYYATPTPRGLRLEVLPLGVPDQANGLYEGLPGGTNPAGPNFFERPAAYAAEAVDLPATVTPNDYPVTDASDKLFGYRLHSWTVAGTSVAPGFSIQGSNALNTVATDATILYNTNTDELITRASVSYGGWFPVLTATGAFTERSYTQILPGLDTMNRLQGITQNLNQTSFGLSASVPLRWISGEFATSLAPSVGLTQFLLKDRRGEELPANFTGLRVGLSGGAVRRRAFQQVQSTLGLTANLIYERGLADATGSRFFLRSRVLLPGLLRTHGLTVGFDYQSEDTQNPYQYADFFQYTRGYNAPFNDDVYRLSVDYQFPLVHPDVGALGIYYLKRIRLNPFFDHGRYNLAQLRDAQTINSAGSQFLFDGTVLNTFDLSVGFEVAYLLSNHAFGPEDRGEVGLRILAVTVL